MRKITLERQVDIKTGNYGYKIISVDSPENTKEGKPGKQVIYRAGNYLLKNNVINMILGNWDISFTGNIQIPATK